MILTVLGHPTPESFNEELAEAYTLGAREAGAQAKLIKVQDMEFDPVLKLSSEDQGFEPCLQAFQQDVEQAKHVTWVFPIWWGTAPAKLKGLIDRAFLPGWAFGYDAKGYPQKLLAGRSARTIMTMDAPNWYYWLFYEKGAQRVFHKAILGYTGFKPIHFTPFYRVRESDRSQRAKWLEKSRKLGELDANRSRKR